MTRELVRNLQRDGNKKEEFLKVAGRQGQKFRKKQDLQRVKGEQNRKVLFSPSLCDPYISQSLLKFMFIESSSVQFSRSVVSDSLRTHESQHARPPCPSPTPGVDSDSRPLSQ